MRKYSSDNKVENNLKQGSIYHQYLSKPTNPNLPKIVPIKLIPTILIPTQNSSQRQQKRWGLMDFPIFQKAIRSLNSNNLRNHKYFFYK